MNTAAYNQLLLAFWRQRDLDAPWGRRFLIALALLGTVVGLYFMPEFTPALLAATTVLWLMSLWSAVIGSLLKQNHPHVARFVPGHLRQLREAALGSWALLSLASTVLLWAFVPRMPSFALLLLLSTATLAFVGWAARTWVLWLIVSFAPVLFFGAGLDRRLAPLWSALRELWLGQPWSVLALCLLAMGASVVLMFGNGDGVHREAYACRDRMRRAYEESMGGKRSGAAALGKPGEWLGKPFERVASGWLRHVIAQARPTASSAMRRAEVVLHGQQHWLRQGMGALLGLVIAVLSFTIAFALAGQGLQDNWTKGAYGMAIGLASMGFNPSFALPNMLWHSRREQALLRLLPGMPQGTLLNRSVAWIQLRHALVAWCVTTAGLALLAWAAHDFALLCLAFGALPLSTGWLLRVPSRMKPPTPWTAIVPVFAFLLTAWGMYALHQKLHTPLLLLAGVSIAVSALLGVWRWRALLAAPVALPTGRLA